MKASTGDIIGVELDLDALTLTFLKNGAPMHNGTVHNIERGTYRVAVSLYHGDQAVSFV